MDFDIEIKRKLREVFDERQATVLSEVINGAFSLLVKATDLNELKGIVKELAEAQRRTEQRVEELAEAQKKTEQRVEELAEAQRRTEQRVEELAQVQKELAEAQKKTEQRVEELAQAQKRTEQRVEELAQAQRRTEEELKDLVREHKITRRELGGLSITIGYSLENEAYRALPKLLKRDFGVVVEGRLRRSFVKDRYGRDIEVNIIGEARRNGRKVMVIGEGKSQLSKNAVNEFLSKKVKRLEGVYKEIFPVLVTHMISEPEVERYIREKKIALYYSYDF